MESGNFGGWRGHTSERSADGKGCGERGGSGDEWREIKSHGVKEMKWEERKTCYPASSARNLEFKNHQSVGRVFC